MTECVEKGTMVDVHGETVSSTHMNTLITGLNELRRADKLLDVTLLVDGLALKAHRVVLAACSDYFSAMFTDPMKESKQPEIKLIGISGRGMQTLVEYAYTGKLDLDRSNIQDILSAATHVQMTNVTTACSNYLESQIDLENCVDIAVLGDLYSLNKLRHKTYRFICSRLEELSKTSEIYNMTFEQLEYILSCDYPVDCTEVKVLQIVAEYCVEKKLTLELARRLFTHIRFNQIKIIDLHVWPQFEQVAESVHSPFYNVMRVVGLQQKKRKKRYGHNSVYSYDILTSNVLTNARGMELAIVKIGGFHMSGLHNQLSFALPSEKKWHSLTVIPHIEQCNYGTAVLGNDLFVVGGSYDVCLKEYIHGFGFRYSASKNEWTTIAPIQSDRCRFSLNAVENSLYAVGGICELLSSGEETLVYGLRASNCERYNPVTDKWEFINPLREKRSQHAGASLGQFLYISGGIDRHLVLASFWRYDTHTDIWERKRSMPTPRADHVLLAIDDKIYACGGWYEDPVTESRVLLTQIELYDVYTDSWHYETTIPVPTFHAGITAVKNTIYFVGGLLSDETINCSSDVQSYDLETKQWSTHTQWTSSKPTWECTCATFYVPRSREGL